MPQVFNRFGPQNLSNPFNHLNQAHSIHQQSQLQHPNAGLQVHNLGGHPTFSGTNQNLNVFGSSPAGTALQGGFGSAPIGLDGNGVGLASHAAQLGFAHGAALEQQRNHENVASSSGPSLKGMGGRIRDVWKNNLAQEMQILRQLVDTYPYISMDTQFPGVIARPIGEFQCKASYHYQTLRCNVDLLKIIQLGITLFSPEGDIPPAQADISAQQRSPYPNNLIMCPCTWVFNFQYSLEDDMYNEDSINSLRKAGADLDKHADMGINPTEFGSLLVTSGLVLSDDVHWISFHSGYDFSYLVKIMWCKPLPNDEDEHKKLVTTFFPNLIDIKYLIKHVQNMLRLQALRPQVANIVKNLGPKAGLQEVADELGCQRVGNPHTAGSDSWLTGLIYFQLRSKLFDGNIPENMNGQMWGLTGVAAPASAAYQAAVLAAQNQGPNGSINFLSGSTPSTIRGDIPSTPTSSHTGLSSTTPGPHGQLNHSGMGSLTPGAGGAFGNFQYGK